jgi:putative transcriptional regulator
MGNKLTSKALVNFEATCDVWQEVLDGVREIKAGKGKRANAEAKTYVVRVRCTTQLYSDPNGAYLKATEVM